MGRVGGRPGTRGEGEVGSWKDERKGNEGRGKLMGEKSKVANR